ncbi:hypothetical protein HK104_005903 [Borealophlyctis nickersoniae]|nr:hypothetical protein HK104_005903 [Borealophlyctis nickersoniae]
MHKLAILQGAIEYIRALQAQVDASAGAAGTPLPQQQQQAHHQQQQQQQYTPLSPPTSAVEDHKLTPPPSPHSLPESDYEASLQREEVAGLLMLSGAAPMPAPQQREKGGPMSVGSLLC